MGRERAIRTSRRSAAPEEGLGLLAKPDFEARAFRDDLDVAGLEPDSALSPRRDDFTLEHNLGEAPVATMLAHLHDHALRAAPHTFARRFEAARHQLADALGQGLRRRLWCGPHDGLFLLRRVRKHMQVGLARLRALLRLLER